jgi:predicted nucleic acid-binding protein
MKDRIFFDTNVILYAYSKLKNSKKEIANSKIFSHENNNSIFISNQVVNEFINIAYKKFELDSKQIESAILELDNCFNIVNFSTITQIKAVSIKEKYKFQYYDSLIIATALENSCTILYSEDMQHDQIIENQLKIINPFMQ